MSYLTVILNLITTSMHFATNFDVLCFLQVHCPDDYRQWLVSMFNLFGTKFVKLYSGPMWRVETTSQEKQTSLLSSKNPIEVCD